MTSGRRGLMVLGVVLTAGAAGAGYHTQVSKEAIDYSAKPGVSVSEQRTADAALVARLPGVLAERYSHDILISRPDYVVYVPEQPMDDRQADKTRRGDTYNDHCHVIANPSNGLLYAFWTQATHEESVDQHVAFSRSRDRGVTWSRPVVLAGSETKANPRLIASWQQPMLAKSGRLYCLWNQQVPGGDVYTGEIYGSYSDDDGSHWSVPDAVPIRFHPDYATQPPGLPDKWCNWQRPLRLGEGGRFFAGCSRQGKASYFPCEMSCCEFWQYENIDENPKIREIEISHFNVNRAAFRVEGDYLKLFTPVPPARHSMVEPSVVKLPDGRLFAMMRSSVGHPFWSQSRDRGRTWDRPKPLVDGSGKPYLHPLSPCPVYDWKGCEAGSGFYFSFVHNRFDYGAKTAMQTRGPLYLIAGRFDPDSEQPVRFGTPRLFSPRRKNNSFYTSYTVVEGDGILWYPDDKFFLLGRRIDSSWFDEVK